MLIECRHFTNMFWTSKTCIMQDNGLNFRICFFGIVDENLWFNIIKVTLFIFFLLLVKHVLTFTVFYAYYIDRHINKGLILMSPCPLSQFLRVCCVVVSMSCCIRVLCL